MAGLNKGRSLLCELALALVAGVGYNGLSVWVGAVAGTSELLDSLTGSAMDPLVWVSRAGTAIAIAALLPAFVLHVYARRNALRWAVLAAILPMIEPLYYHIEAGFGFELNALAIAVTYLVLPLAWVSLFRLLAMQQQPHCPTE